MADAVITESVESADGVSITVTITDETTFEALRDALADPVWLIGATWEMLTTNDFKRGRFADAFGAWASHTAAEDIHAVLEATGVEASR